jgi:hypothetical protein
MLVCPQFTRQFTCFTSTNVQILTRESTPGFAESPADASRKEKEQKLDELPNLFRDASNAGDLGNSRGPAAHTRCTMQQVSDQLQQYADVR